MKMESLEFSRSLSHDPRRTRGRSILLFLTGIVTGLLAMLVSPTGAASEVTHGPIVGHVTDNSALIWARCSPSGMYQLTIRNERAVTDSVTVTAEARDADDGCVVWQLDELRPDTRYSYEISVAREKIVVGQDYFIKTAAAPGPSVVRLAFASCAKEDEGSAGVWRRMRLVDPHAVVLLGDTPYIDSTELSFQRQRHQQFLAVSDFATLLRNRSLYATWDDHDFGRNDTDGNLPGKLNSRQAFVEYHANPTYGDGHSGIYTQFRRGAAHVFLLDTRFFAATEPSPVDSDRPTLLGKRQWQWLLRELRASTAPFKVLACGMIWNGAVRPGKQDHWGSYAHEREALFRFIGESRISGVVLVGGDVHRSRVLRHGTIESAGYQITELITSPVHDSVIEAANAPHRGLIHDAGEPNSFLLLTADDTSQPASLSASFMNHSGREFHALRVEFDF